MKWRIFLRHLGPPDAFRKKKMERVPHRVAPSSDLHPLLGLLRLDSWLDFTDEETKSGFIAYALCALYNILINIRDIESSLEAWEAGV